MSNAEVWTQGYLAGWNDRNEDECNPLPAGEQRDTPNPYADEAGTVSLNNEPPVGSWVMDRFGATHYRTEHGWAAAPTGFVPAGRWQAMWEHRGPLTLCGPWGL